MYSVLNTLSECTYFYTCEKTLHDTLFCLFLKLSKALVNKYISGGLLENMLILLICFLCFLDWNPNIAPKYWMVDFNTAEILSLENIIHILECFYLIFTQSSHGIGITNS